MTATQSQSHDSRDDSQHTSGAIHKEAPCRSRPIYPLTVLRISLGYATYHLCNIIFALFMAPLALLLLPFPRTKYRCLHFLVHAYLAFYTRKYLPALGAYKIAEISGMERLRGLGPAIYVANHRSRIDALFLLGLLNHTGIVVKAKYAAAPALAALVTHFDFVSTDTSRLSSLSGMLAKCRALIAQGRNLLVFPEGSRATSGRLQPFKDFAFMIAKENNCPVVPVIVHSTAPFLTRIRGSLFPRDRNIYRIRFLEPELIAPSDTQNTVSDRVRAKMARELRDLDRGTVWETSTRETTWAKT